MSYSPPLYILPSTENRTEHLSGKCHPSPSLLAVFRLTVSLAFLSPPTHFQISPIGPGMGWSGFCLAKSLNPYSPWPREVPTVPACITLCSQPVKGGAEDPGPVMQGVPRAPVPGASQPLISTPALRLVMPCRFSPYWKLETPGSASPAPRLRWQKVGEELIMIYFCGGDHKHTPHSIRAPQYPSVLTVCWARLLP